MAFQIINKLKNNENKKILVLFTIKNSSRKFFIWFIFIFLETNETQGHFAFKKDYRRGKNGGLDFLNVALMEEQKKVIISLIKQAGSNIIHGRSFMNVSLPLEVFEPRSFLERLARSFGHAPDFLGLNFLNFW